VQYEPVTVHNNGTTVKYPTTFFFQIFRVETSDLLTLATLSEESPNLSHCC